MICWLKKVFSKHLDKPSTYLKVILNKNVYRSNELINFSLQNHDKKTVWFSRPFVSEIQRKQPSDWKTWLLPITPSDSNNNELYKLLPGENLDYSYQFSFLIDKKTKKEQEFLPGEYRLVFSYKNSLQSILIYKIFSPFFFIIDEVKTSCQLCQRKAVSRQALEKLKEIKIYLDFSDDSHLSRKLLQCSDCGQLYFYEFLENNWPASETEEQYRTYIPVNDETQAEKYNQMSSTALATISPAIHCDFTETKKEPIWL